MAGRQKESRFARTYLRLAPAADARGVAAHRHTLLEGLDGRVCEVGSGQGLNFAHYPAAVTGVVAVEPDVTLRRAARGTAGSAPVPVALVAGEAEALPLADASCDAVVACLVLCSVADQPRALAEARRVLRPDGRLVFYEHVRSGHRLAGGLEDLVAPLWSRLAGGCHPNRDTAAAISAAGFTIEAVDRFGFSPGAGLPRTAHVLGRARRP